MVSSPNRQDVWIALFYIRPEELGFIVGYSYWIVVLDSAINITPHGSVIKEGLEEERCSRCGSCTRPVSAINFRALTPIHLRLSDFKVVVRVIVANRAVTNCRKYKIWFKSSQRRLTPRFTRTTIIRKDYNLLTGLSNGCYGTFPCKATHILWHSSEHGFIPESLG